MEQTLAHIHGAPVWTKNDYEEEVLQVICSVDITDKQARKKINYWSEYCCSCLSWANEEVGVNKDIVFVVEVIIVSGLVLNDIAVIFYVYALWDKISCCPVNLSLWIHVTLHSYSLTRITLLIIDMKHN